MNRDDGTSALTVMDDAQAVALFLHERASRSRHTLHAYAANLRRLIGWCRNRHLGPLSDLTRNDLLAWRDHLRMVRVSADSRQCAAAAGELTQARVLAVAASLYQYWFDTGYLIANPASGLVTERRRTPVLHRSISCRRQRSPHATPGWPPCRPASITTTSCCYAGAGFGCCTAMAMCGWPNSPGRSTPTCRASR